MEQLPQHVAIIMDGNGRWAQSRGLERVQGHRAGAKTVQNIVTRARELGIRYLTLFSFSTENWGRAQEEVGSLMDLFRQYLDSELNTLLKNNVRLRAIGDLARLPFPVRSALHRNIERTRENNGLDLVLAVSYSGRLEIVEAARKLCKAVQHGELKLEEIDSTEFAKRLWTADIPDPDLLIRTSNEMRISNFLLWQLAYSEIVVAPDLWPDFSVETFESCLSEYSKRERRFGLSSDQLKAVKEGSQL